jgi:hypothetical protein
MSSATETANMVALYLESLSVDERQAFDIAREFFQSAFCIEESRGFLQFVAQQKKASDGSGT